MSSHLEDHGLFCILLLKSPNFGVGYPNSWENVVFLIYYYSKIDSKWNDKDDEDNEVNTVNHASEKSAHNRSLTNKNKKNSNQTTQ